MTSQDEHNVTSFGFRNVPVADKQNLVRNVFDSVADRYDLMNDLMSGGVHRLWKQAMVDWLNPQPGQHILDVAGGTGDIAFRIMERLNKRARPNGLAPGQVTICDINPAMLEVGCDRALAQPYDSQSHLKWICGNAERLPLPDRTLDGYTIAFGIRNVTHIDKALKEAYRVLKPGGRFLCLEFSAVQMPGLDALYDRLSFDVIPRLGDWITGDKDSYQYLVESIRQFPDQNTFKAMIEQAGFGNVQFRNLTGGVAALHSAWRI